MHVARWTDGIEPRRIQVDLPKFDRQRRATHQCCPHAIVALFTRKPTDLTKVKRLVATTAKAHAQGPMAAAQAPLPCAGSCRNEAARVKQRR